MTGERIDKTERLLNLTLALIAARRPMSKSEIFNVIPGYGGNIEAKERMFERDKDELRDMGIAIQVVPIDAFFDDEFGYQIIPKDFFLPDITLTQPESIWLALATTILRDSSNSFIAESAFQKILGNTQVSVDEMIQRSRAWNFDVPLNESLLILWQALKEKCAVEFRYTSHETSTRRIVYPYTLTSRHGAWYLIAQDDGDKRIKSFKVNRIFELTLSSQSIFSDLPEGFDLSNFLKAFKGERLPEVIVKIHKELSPMHPLLKNSLQTPSADRITANSLLTLRDLDRTEALEMILWSGDSVEVIAPIEFRSEIIESLKRVVEANS